ncbi:hypothetical protein AALP_AA5G048400 [Arabis alpina]|uniref:Uncharacterized protein n=1 Tax=Arabis alpina TaxID=50452 RepID=A0A087GUZ6_ARAAL|nr:hypothetical protein AALP_AA5G048400 [Arabis alpina]
MQSKPTSGVIRRSAAPSSCRYYPYATGSRSGKKYMKDEVVRLGFKLSVSLAESMFLLCDDIRSMLWFCYKLFRDANSYQKSESSNANSDSPVVKRMLRVSHHVYSKYIQPKNEGGVFDQDGGNPFQCELIRTIWKDFADGIIVLHRLVMLLRRKDCSFDDRLLLSAIAKYKKLLKNLEDKLRSSGKDANGFARKAMESNIFSFWKSLFDEEATPKARKNMIVNDMFNPLFDVSKRSTFGFISHSELPALTVYSPYILGKDFAKQELKEEVVHLGVELSLYVAEMIGEEICLYVRAFTTGIEERLKNVEEELKGAKAVSEANGFAREAMESDIMDLWKSVFDKEAKEATQTLKVINMGILRDIFLPLLNAAAPP